MTEQPIILVRLLNEYMSVNISARKFHVLIMNMGVAAKIKPKIQSLGLVFKPVSTDSIVV